MALSSQASHFSSPPPSSCRPPGYFTDGISSLTPCSKGAVPLVPGTDTARVRLGRGRTKKGSKPERKVDQSDLTIKQGAYIDPLLAQNGYNLHEFAQPLDIKRLNIVVEARRHRGTPQWPSEDTTNGAQRRPSTPRANCGSRCSQNAILDAHHWQLELMRNEAPAHVAPGTAYYSLRNIAATVTVHSHRARTIRMALAVAIFLQFVPVGAALVVPTSAALDVGAALDAADLRHEHPRAEVLGIVGIVFLVALLTVLVICLVCAVRARSRGAEQAQPPRNDEAGHLSSPCSDGPPTPVEVREAAAGTRDIHIYNPRTVNILGQAHNTNFGVNHGAITNLAGNPPPLPPASDGQHPIDRR
ncbi:hypothetical protein NMY22_g5050 [Coprinellus aureogranulatus]|nr:hypothetical protein NMY22_g5050 [Coprinellus aureogranulatus]